MNQYDIRYDVNIDGTHICGEVELFDRTMNAHLARQYAAADLFDHYDVNRATVDVGDISVEWTER